MNLDYIYKNDIHEKYVLDQLSKEERNAYEAFLKENKQAQKELQDTRNLIDGLRDAGADSMRREIERQVEEIRSPKADWSLIYKAAAVLFIFVLLPSVIYFQVFDKPEELIAEQTAPVAYEEKMTEEDVDELITKRNGSSSIESVQESRVKKKESAPLEANTRVKPIHDKKDESLLADFESNKEDDNIGAGAVAKPQTAKMRSDQTESISLAESADIAGSEISIDKAEPNIELEKTLSKAGGYASGSSAMRSSAAQSKQKGLVSSFGEESAIKNYSFVSNKNTIGVSMRETDSELNFPQSFSVSIVTRKPDFISLEWNVSPKIYSLKKDNIVVNWNNKDSLSITFLDKHVYTVQLDSVNTEALKAR